MTHFMSLSKLEKNLSKWNANCRNNWDIPNDQKSRRQKEIDKTFDKVESILDRAWKDHIKNHVRWEWEIPCQFYIEENEYDKRLAVWSPDKKRVAFVSERKTVKIFDTKTGTLEQDLRKNAIEIESIAWSPNGEYIFVNLWCESTVEIWNVERKKCVKCLDSHKEDILAAAWSPNGKYIVTTSMDGTVKINDVTLNLPDDTYDWRYN